MSLDWSTGQRRCLGALGFTLLRPLSSPPVAVAPSDATDRFSRALLRAARQDAGANADAAAWFREHALPAPALLRGDPAAKRALWPRLRAMRRKMAQP